ncbi:hypothetical protein [Winogradskyella sp. PG-2]|uniref:hypothetical protein n=1 Tax=Winogradskyella sp. PG-2 TaxID=754409 RepID=UPI00045895AC|nr:hypothetical protein [Winogradskyella sp. PG-2]BAO75722.1 hypothetical protein WPG_1492 [Winogradskyella sp. PG-2]
MNHTFKEFSTSAIFNIGNETDLESFSKAKQAELCTFIWANSEAIEIIIDSIPFTIESNSILALTPIQYL